MNHRISAGMFVVSDDERVLMVRHKLEGKYDFWVAPGGGAKGSESLQEASVREVREETGLVASPGRLIYIEEFFSPERRYCKFWFLGRVNGGSIDVSAPEAREEHIVEAAWLGQAELLQRQVFPECLPVRFWQDKANGVLAPQHLGIREMQFW